MFSNEQLIGPDFDEVAYLRYALRAANHSAEHARLESCIAEVKRDIQSALAEHADSLIDQARCTYKTQREVTAVRQSTDSLQKASGRLRIMIEEPYMQLQSRVKELEATQEVIQLLQSTLRFLSLTARLQEQLATTSSVDIVRSSYTLKELEEVLQDGAIRSLQVVEAQLPAVERHATTIRSKAHELLAMTELTAPPSGNGGTGSAAAVTPATASTSRLALQVSTGLQCAHVLRMLSRTVQSFMTERRREVLRTIMRELDAQAIEEHISSEYDRLSRSSLSGHSGAMSEQTVTAHAVLQHIQKTLFIAVQHTRCVILLWRVLLQRRDTQTQELYLFSIDSPVQLLVEYWSTITEKLRERLNSLQKRHAIRLALASAYPRYHHLVASFLSRTDVASVAEGPLSTGAPGGAATDSLGSAVTGAAGTAAALLSIHVTQCGMGDYLDLIDTVDAAVRRGVAGNGGEGTPFKTPDKSPSAHIGTATPPRTDTQDMRHTWLAQVTDEARGAFRTHVLDRHREVIGGVFLRLSAAVPPSAAAAGQTATVAPVRMQGGRRPSIPPQANTLDMAVYTRLVTQEVQMFRQDPHTLDVLLDCVFSTLRQVRAKLTEAIKRYPLPPLPAVTAAPTLTQVMHLSIANGCTTLAYDCAAVLAMVPHPSASQTAGGGAGAGGAAAASNATSGAHRHAHQDPYALVLEQLGTKRMELQQLIDTFHNMSERSTKPFADSAASVLLPTLTQAVDNVLRNELALSSAAAATAASEGRAQANPAMPLGGSGGGDSRTALVQLQSQCRQFTDRFFFLVDARTSGWMEACQHVTNTMLARLLIRLATTPPPATLRGTPLATAPAYAQTLQVMVPPLLQFVQMVQSAGTGGRITSLLRGCVRQVELFYETCGGLGGSGSGDGASAAAALRAAVMERLRPPIPLFFAKLLVLQYGLFTTPASAPSENSQGAVGPSALAGALQLSEQGLLECLEGVLLTESSARVAATSSNMEGGGTPAAGATGADRKGEVLSALDALFLEVVAAAPSESAACLQELWASVQEK
ncbi:Golgi transport complex subunit 5 [Leishmania donovani]|uniref:Conserved oligomeric Golgi complex subunit 5 n=1 Tax=Leishmania donovani TaxID=5661 RepID=A0A504XJA8_LEIDO|nr:Golgi transport complex subunit 5 family protein [Leishmania donovani]CAJ1991874.1 Golgi transport complex subunit 5 [Leishmania donovani]VDZ47712.1 Golgi_transport_complex_subunit_5_putative/Pfam:PF10392 [Leishmania donovani]